MSLNYDVEFFDCGTAAWADGRRTSIAGHA